MCSIIKEFLTCINEIKHAYHMWCTDRHMVTNTLWRVIVWIKLAEVGSVYRFQNFSNSWRFDNTISCNDSQTEMSLK